MSKEHGIIVWDSSNLVAEFVVEGDVLFLVDEEGVCVGGKPAIWAVGRLARNGLIWQIVVLRGVN